MMLYWIAFIWWLGHQENVKLYSAFLFKIENPVAWLEVWVSVVKSLPANAGGVSSIGKIPWRRKWQIHSSILAWEIPWMEEPGGL